MLIYIETNKVKKRLLFNKTRQYTHFFIKLPFSSIGQDNSKLQKQTS